MLHLSLSFIAQQAGNINVSDAIESKYYDGSYVVAKWRDIANIGNEMMPSACRIINSELPGMDNLVLLSYNVNVVIADKSNVVLYVDCTCNNNR